MLDLAVNDKLNINGTEMVIDHVARSGDLVLRDHFGRSFEFAANAMVKKIEKGEAEVLGRSFSSSRRGEIITPVLSEKQQARVDWVWPYVMAYVNRGLTSYSKQTLQELRDSVQVDLPDGVDKPSISTIYRALKKYELSSQTSASAIAPDFHKCGNRTPRHAPHVCEAREEAVRYYLSRERPSLVQAHAVMVGRIAKKVAAVPNVIPSSKVISRRLDEMDAREIKRRRHGGKAANQDYARVHRVPRPSVPLEDVRLDHTPVHTFLAENMLADEYAKIAPIIPERCTLSMVVDRFSNAILGIHLSYEKESTATALEAVRHAVLTKDEYVDSFRDHPVKELRPKNNWPMYGKPRRLFADNGSAHKSDVFTKAVTSVNITVELTKVANPKSNGAIERMFRTLNQFGLSSLPGATFSNAVDRGDYDSTKRACFGIDILEAFLVKLIVDVYHQRKQRALGNKTPQEKWSEGVEVFPIPIIDSQDDIFKLMGYRYMDHEIHRTGVNVEGMWFDSDELNGLMCNGARARKTKVEIRLDPRDLTFAYVIDQDTGEILEVPNVEAEIINSEGMTLNTVRAIRMAQLAETNEEKVIRFRQLADAGDLYLAASKGFGQRRKKRGKKVKDAPNKREETLLEDPEWESRDLQDLHEDEADDDKAAVDAEEAVYEELLKSLEPLVNN
ncbi:MAG: DDE-type integrase/transposase/recombinase [Rhodospirillales bacterium]|nr:DDE-type integrase/transposase/recombinase [Rhodospirillales bacterium]